MLRSHEDARVCAALTRKHARTFAFASAFLPARKQRGAFALYAFCRRADDIVDRVAADRPVHDASRELAAYRDRLAEALAGTSEDAAFRELAWTAHEFAIPLSLLNELLDGIASDLIPTSFETWEDVAAYAEGVAASVGEMLVHVFGTATPHGGVGQPARYARTLGVAMQLTNILRDVGEDAARGRCYLPAEDLQRFGFSVGDVLHGGVDPRDSAWRRLLVFEIARARTLYREAAPGIALLAPDARRCTWLCASGYAAILGAIEKNGFDTLTVRARVSGWDRARIMLGTWSSPADVAAAPPGSFSVTG